MLFLSIGGKLKYIYVEIVIFFSEERDSLELSKA